MRALAVTAFVLAAFIGAATAHSHGHHCMKPAANLYPTTSSCPAYNACGAAFCSCVGAASGNTNASTCLGAASQATCATVQTCLATYQGCVWQLHSYSSNSSSPCFMLGSAISVANVAAGTNGFANSTLQKSCQYRTCSIMNSSSLTCDFGTADANVCMMPSMAPTPRPTAPTGTLPTNFEAAIVAQLRIEGSAFAELLSSNRAGLETAITNDLGTLLQIAASFIRVTNMVVGSLVVTFAVSASAGVQPSTLNSRLAEATASTAWLSSTQSVYSTVSNETLRVTEAPNVLVTAAPGSVTTGAPTTAAPTTAAPSGSPSAAVVSAFATVLAVAAAVVAL